MMESVYIRPLTPQETPLLTTFLYHAIFIPEGMEPPPRSIVEKPELQVYVAAFGTHPHDHAFVAEAAGQVVGAVWVRDMPDYGHVEDGVPSFAISVLPQYRNQGVGTALLQRMLSHLAGAGYSKASLSVQKQNPAARLYRRLGFQTVGETDEEYLMAFSFPPHAANSAK